MPWSSTSTGEHLVASNPPDGVVLDWGGYFYNVSSTKNPNGAAKGDGKNYLNGAMGTGSAVLTDTTNAPFVSTDQGKSIAVVGAGAAAALLLTTIASVQSASQVTLAAANASGGPVSGTEYGYVSDDKASIQGAINAAGAGGGGAYCRRSTYGLSASLTVANGLLQNSVCITGVAVSPGIDASGNPRPPGGVCFTPTAQFPSGNALIVADATNAPGNVIVGFDVRNIFLDLVPCGLTTSNVGLAAGLLEIGVWDGAVDRVNASRPNGIAIRCVGFGPTTGNSSWITGSTVSQGGAAATGHELGNWESGIERCAALNQNIGLILSGGVGNPITAVTYIDDTCTTYGKRYVGGRASILGCGTFSQTTSGANLRVEDNRLTVVGGQLTQENNANGNSNITDSSGHQGNLFMGVRFRGATGGTLTTAVYEGGAGISTNPNMILGGEVINPTRYTQILSVSGGNYFVCRSLIGFNPQGIFTITATASPMTITDDKFVDRKLYIVGGTVTTVTKGGQTIYSAGGAAANASLDQSPGESCILTYTVAPTIIEDRR